jgi:predicted DNA binding CopG/RHH family protein
MPKGRIDMEYYDREEKNILDAYKSGKMIPFTPSKTEIEAIKATAQNTFKKDKRITIRLYDHDFTGIQKKSWKWASPIKRSFPASSTAISKAN